MTAITSTAPGIRRVLARLSIRLGVLAVVFVGLWFIHSSSGALVIERDPGPALQDEETVATASKVERLMHRHDCWRGEGPVDVIPGWAIVMRPGGTPERLPAEVGFRIWAGEAPGKLFGFCR